MQNDGRGGEGLASVWRLVVRVGEFLGRGRATSGRASSGGSWLGRETGHNSMRRVGRSLTFTDDGSWLGRETGHNSMRRVGRSLTFANDFGVGPGFGGWESDAAAAEVGGEDVFAVLEG